MRSLTKAAERKQDYHSKTVNKQFYERFPTLNR